MAIYVPASRRRRKIVLVAALAFAVGGAAGTAMGRATAPSVEARVRSAQEQSRAIAAQLRVLSLHEETGAASLSAGGDAGAAFALRRARSDLERALGEAPWIPGPERARLLGGIDALRRHSATASGDAAAFGAATDRLAGEIEADFGLGVQRAGR
jgi:hypothetical protein